MTKAELRKIYLQKRQALSESEFLQLNLQLCENFFANIDFSRIKVIHSFLPIEKQREVNTWLIIERVRKEFPHIRISIPKINTENATLDNFYYEGSQQLENNLWGIPEPRQGIPTPIDAIDIVLVPLLAVDKKGNRVGYGRGFYDKFLANVNPNTQTIGLSLFQPVETITDVHSSDICLRNVITPSEVIGF